MTTIGFNHLPKESILQILSHATVSKEDAFNYRLVCKDWKKFCDQDAFKVFVRQLPQKTDLPRNTDRSIGISNSDQINPNLTEVFQVNIGQKILVNPQLPKPSFVTSSFKKIEKTPEERKNLFILWEKIKGWIKPMPPSNLQTAEDIFLWMQNHPTEMASIAYLDLADTGLTAIPSEIGMLTQLKKLYLGKNKIKFVPQEIGKLTQLEVLWLNGNQITVNALSKEMGNLSKLKVLNIENNSIVGFPDEVTSLVGLEGLYLKGNMISRISRKINACAQLTNIDLGNNQITELPIELMNCPKLNTLNLEGNSLSSIPHQILYSSKSVFSHNPTIQDFKKKYKYD
jgi:Leucine-rich repeat (LRR) protein